VSKKKKPKVIALNPYERIVAIVPQEQNGRWDGKIVWIYVQDSRNGEISAQYLRQDEQTDEMKVLFAISEEVRKALYLAVPIKEKKA